MSRGRLLLYLFTALVFFIAGLSVFAEPPPIWVPLALAVSYMGLLFFGVMKLSWEMFGDAVSRVPEAEGQVALTFDDGPDPVSTPLALEKLARAGAKATFFLVGKKVEKHPQIVKAIAEAGHSLGVHTYGHSRLYAFVAPKEVQKDIVRTRALIEQACGVAPLWFRPPVGQMSPRTAAGVKLAGAETIAWNVRALDGLEKTSAEECSARVCSQLEEGAIVLMHDAWESREVEEGASPSETLARCPAGVQALDAILNECKRRQIKPVTVDTLLAQIER